MKWSWKIGQFAGIGVYMHATFLLLVGWVALSHWISDRSIQSVISGVAFIGALFFCVVCHEFGHALTARKYGIKTRDITLLPIGGVARLERMPEDPRQELWVALAGPAVSVSIAVLLILWLQLSSAIVPVGQLSISGGSLLERLMIVNLFLALFNLLPAFPMDGGRVLRAILAMNMEHTRATQVAAALGQGMALIFGFLGFFINPFLLFIAFFVWMGAAQESSMAQMKSALGGIPVAKAMVTDVRTLSPEDNLARAVELILTGTQEDFPVVIDGRPVGILNRRDLLAGLTQRGDQALVSEFMQKDFMTVDYADMLETVAMRLQECQCRTLPVLRNELLVGLMTMDNMGEFLMIRSALESSKVKPRTVDTSYPA